MRAGCVCSWETGGEVLTCGKDRPSGAVRGRRGREHGGFRSGVRSIPAPGRVPARRLPYPGSDGPGRGRHNPPAPSRAAPGGAGWPESPPSGPRRNRPPEPSGPGWCRPARAAEHRNADAEPRISSVVHRARTPCTVHRAPCTGCGVRGAGCGMRCAGHRASCMGCRVPGAALGPSWAHRARVHESRSGQSRKRAPMTAVWSV